MMAKAHVTIGTAAALTAVMPGSVPEAVTVTAAAVLGSMACDIELVSDHRGFSHSLLALAVESICLWLVLPAVAIPFAIAFASHIALDLTNKKPVKLFYPVKKGFCLGWFCADGFANSLFAAAGLMWLAAAAVICLKGM